MADEPFTFSVRRDGDQVHLEICGEMKEDGAKEAIAAFLDALPLVGEFEFHAHLKRMTKYEKAARERWTETLSDVRDRCRRITIYGASALIRMAAATVALIARIPMDFEDEPKR
jgi:hypothetical protein